MTLVFSGVKWERQYPSTHKTYRGVARRPASCLWSLHRLGHHCHVRSRFASWLGTSQSSIAPRVSSTEPWPPPPQAAASGKKMGFFLASPAFARSQTCTRRKRFSRLRRGGPSWHPGKETASGCAGSPRSPTAAPLSPGDSSRQPLAQAAGDGALGWAVEPARLVYRVSAGALPASCLPCLLWMYMKHLGSVWGFIAIWGLSLQPDRVVPTKGLGKRRAVLGRVLGQTAVR